jgi:ABC-type sulfate transport system substrate-binding protein
LKRVFAPWTSALQQYQAQFPTPRGRLYSIADFGGWTNAKPAFFGDTGVYSKIEAELAKKR